MDPKQLLLNTLSVMLIIFNTTLENECPQSPQNYHHIWDFYCKCQLFCSTIRKIISFLDLSQVTMHADIHLLVGQFTKDLVELEEHMNRSSVEADQYFI